MNLIRNTSTQHYWRGYERYKNLSLNLNCNFLVHLATLCIILYSLFHHQHTVCGDFWCR